MAYLTDSFILNLIFSKDKYSANSLLNLILENMNYEIIIENKILKTNVQFMNPKSINLKFKAKFMLFISKDLIFFSY